MTTEITVDQACRALGVDAYELEQSLRDMAVERLKAAETVAIAHGHALPLEAFDDYVAGARRLFESALEARKAWQEDASS